MLRTHVTSGLTRFEEHAENGQREAYGTVEVKQSGGTVARVFLHLALRADGTPELALLASAEDAVDEQLGFVATKELILYGAVALGLLELAERARALLRDASAVESVLDVELP
jgi:hypothetical protein